MFTPSTKPRQNELATLAQLRQGGSEGPVELLGVRGYYRRTMGDPETNDRGIYDDAIFLRTPTVYAAFNANTDPGVRRRGVAVLAPGLWLYKLGIHGLSKPAARRYPALVQAGEVEVRRDGGRGERGFFGINIHRGGATTTSSLGCQTIVPSQWEAFIALVRSELKRHGARTVSYLLVET